jgi:hypothetical protein
VRPTAAILLVFLSGCAARRFAVPTDPGTPLTDLAAVQAQVFQACSGVRTLQVELSLSGRAGRQRLRGRVHAGFERPASMRLEGLAPIGAPMFILFTRGESATLLLPRDRRVVRGARPEQILDALTGVALAPADLLAILTGCVEPSPRLNGGRVHGNGIGALDLAGGATLYVRRQGTAWLPTAARRDGWVIEYQVMGGMFPGVVRLRSESGSVAVDVTVTLAQVETNLDLPPRAFAEEIPADTAPMTLDELRDAGPLRGAQ